VEAHIVERILQCINVEKYDRPGEGSLKLSLRLSLRLLFEALLEAPSKGR
jgi:hypothetical protein